MKVNVSYTREVCFAPERATRVARPAEARVKQQAVVAVQSRRRGAERWGKARTPHRLGEVYPQKLDENRV